MYNIPRKTLYNKLQNKNPRNYGHPTVFSAKEKASFESYLLLLAEYNMPITKEDLKINVIKYLEKLQRVIKCF